MTAILDSGFAPVGAPRNDNFQQVDSRVQLVVNIIVLSAIYALIACGYVLIYRVSRVLNLAHGELMMLGAYLLLATARSSRQSARRHRRGDRAQPRWSACWSTSS